MLSRDDVREELIRQLDAGIVVAADVARELEISGSRMTEMKSRERKVQDREMPLLISILKMKDGSVRSPVNEWRGPELEEPLFQSPESSFSDMEDYVPVSILPTFVGAGGGGSGDDEAKYELMPRSLIEIDLRGKPIDFMLVNVRGESMEPDFHHGDQILIDRRDNNPIQPGAFALWDGDAHVIKLVERVPQKRGWYRVFSANQRFSEYQVNEDEIAIIGRPVWFGRRL